MDMNQLVDAPEVAPGEGPAVELEQVVRQVEHVMAKLVVSIRQPRLEDGGDLAEDVGHQLDAEAVMVAETQHVLAVEMSAPNARIGNHPIEGLDEPRDELLQLLDVAAAAIAQELDEGGNELLAPGPLPPAGVEHGQLARLLVPLPPLALDEGHRQADLPPDFEPWSEGFALRRHVQLRGPVAMLLDELPHSLEHGAGGPAVDLLGEQRREIDLGVEGVGEERPTSALVGEAR